MALKPLLLTSVFSGICVPSLAQAHNFFGDTQPLLNGVAHPFVTLPHVVLLCALVLAFLWQPKIQLGIAGTVIGFIAGFTLRAVFGFEDLSLYPVIIAFILLWGADVAARKSLPPAILSGLTFITGAVIGLDTDSQMDNWFFAIVFCIGSLIGITALFAYGSLAKCFLKYEWVCVAIRTLGAWLVAVGAMMLAFFLNGAS